MAKYFQLKNKKHVKVRWDLGCKKCSSLSSKTLNGVFPQGAHSALGMSAVLARAAASTHEILDSHRHNSSLEAGQMAFFFPQDLGALLQATIHKVKHVWRPICRNAHIFSCDENNFWDIHYASHRQTMALMQTGGLQLDRDFLVKLP